MDEEPNMPSTRYPPNTIYIIRARVRVREILELRRYILNVSSEICY